MSKLLRFKKRAPSANLNQMEMPLFAHHEPQSVLAEQFRTIRTNIEYASFSKAVKSIAVSSSVAQEGKSTVAANLACVLGQTESKVLIVDSDLRKPTVHHTFQVDNSLGLTTLITNPRIQFNRVAQYDHNLNIYIIPSGSIPTNPVDLIRSSQMAYVMKEMQKYFDYIIYDTPPLNNLSDAQIIAARTDGVLLVVRQNYVTKSQVSTAAESLGNMKANILGYVMNDVEAIEQTYYYQYQ